MPHRQEQTMNESTERTWVTTKMYWEDAAGYARAVRVGNHIWVSGCTATEKDGLPITDPAEQTRGIIDQIEKVIEKLGGKLADVVQTRMYISDLADIKPIALVHGERFKDIRPANFLAQVGLSSGILVEIEAEAIVGSSEQMQLMPES
jgi:enamine deaminase RidA (YjgF/YER057c/UK114 family)